MQTVDQEEIARFSRIADEWWDSEGKFKPLHRINPLRIGFIKQQICMHFAREATANEPLAGLRLLDIGCGGGLIAEPMCRMGAHVTGIDASEKNIRVASLHAEQSGLSIDYRVSSAEALAAQGTLFDVVLALEIIEHVADVEAFISACCQLARPGGLVVFSTLNRTPKAFALAIVGAEYVLRWLPRGTHQWAKFVKPSELSAGLRKERMHISSLTGMVMNPLNFEWRLTPDDLSVNYLLVASKP